MGSPRLSKATFPITGLVVATVMAGHGTAAEGTVPLPDRNPRRAVVAVQPQAAPPPGAPVTLPVRNPKALKETTFDARAVLKPLLEYELAKADRESLRAAISSVYKLRFPAALAALKRVRSEEAKKVGLWYYYRSHGAHASAADIEAFRIANPDWPNQDRLRLNAERSLFLNDASPEAIKTQFADKPPQSGAGKAALAAMYLAAGDKDKAASLIREAWRGHLLTSDIEEAILKRFAGLLTEADHKARVDRLLYQDRKSRIPAVLRTARLLPESERKKIEARVAVVRRSSAAEKLLGQITEDAAKHDIGLFFSRIQWLRRNEREQDAWTMLRMAPNEPAKLLDLGEWWIERRVNARSALNAGHAQVAYELASDHGLLTGNYYAEAEFMAGWVALRFLGKAEVAQKHFLALRTSANEPDQTASAEYWLGRTSEALGRKDEAAAHYANAGKYPLTYYGQLARQAASPDPTDLVIDPTPEPKQQDVKNFLARDAVKAIAVIREADLDNLTPLFFHQLARTITSPGEMVLLAELARTIDQPHASVRLGKIALNRGLPMAAYAYPVGLLPEYKKLNGSVEAAFLHALSRQESEFNPQARSPVGARGLMQLMPKTARAVARQYKVRYRKSKLTDDPAYNMMLGVAHLRDLLDGFNGSYILALAAYNAGGPRIEEWIGQFGDPRQPQTDAIDWVERIPFTETREYVQKILTTIQIFRARLAGPDKALRLFQDLNRRDGAPDPGTRTKEAEVTAGN